MTRAFLISFALFLLLAPREPWSGAARLHTVAAHELLAHGAPDLVSEGDLPDTWVRGGRRWAVAPIGPTLGLLPLEVPLLAAPHSVKGALVVRLVEAAGAAAGAALLYALLASLVGASAALLFATSIVVAARIPDGSVWAALLLLSGVLAARRFAVDSSRRSALLLGAAAGALALFDLTAPSLVLLAWALIFAEQRRALGWSLWPFAAGVALALCYRLLSGAPPPPRGDLLEGLDGLLLSTGKSLFLYSPPLVLALPGLRRWWRTRRPDALLVLAVVVVVLLPAASLERWDGDPAWGPRRLVPLVPLLLWPACAWLKEEWSRTWARTLTALLVAAGIWVQVLGMAFPAESWLKLTAAVKTSTGAGGWFVHSDQVHFMPQFSPLAGHAWMLKSVWQKNQKPEAPPWTLLQPGRARYDAEYQRLRLDWWALAFSRDTVSK
jgi:hypothetical protein